MKANKSAGVKKIVEQISTSSCTTAATTAVTTASFKTTLLPSRPTYPSIFPIFCRNARMSRFFFVGHDLLVLHQPRGLLGCAGNGPRKAQFIQQLFAIGWQLSGLLLGSLVVHPLAQVFVFDFGNATMSMLLMKRPELIELHQPFGIMMTNTH